MTKVKRIDKLLKARRRLIKLNKISMSNRYNLNMCKIELTREICRIKNKDFNKQFDYSINAKYYK
jgi:hypothetical protein